MLWECDHSPVLPPPPPTEEGEFPAAGSSESFFLFFLFSLPPEGNTFLRHHMSSLILFALPSLSPELSPSDWSSKSLSDASGSPPGDAAKGEGERERGRERRTLPPFSPPPLCVVFLSPFLLPWARKKHTPN